MKEESSVNAIINKLVKKYKLGEILEEPIRVSGGLLNRMYKVNTTRGTFAIKHLNPEVMKRKEAINNHIFAETVSTIAKDSGVSCLPAKIFDNQVLQQVEDYYFLVFDWFEGCAIEDKELTIEKCRKVARELAKLHRIDFSHLKKKCKAYYNIDEVNWKFYLNKIQNKKSKRIIS